MKTITKNLKLFALALLTTLAFKSYSQGCTANFTHSVGLNGFVNFFSTSTPVNSITTQYYWTFGNGNTFTSTGSPIANTTYTANGIYTVSLFFITVPTCSNMVTYTISVNTVNSSTCNINANFNYTQGSNGLVNFNNTSTGTVSGVTYVWNFGDNSAPSTAVSPAHTYSANGTYIATLTANNNLSVTCVDTQTMAIVVNSYCTLNAGFSYTINANGNVSFFNATTPSVGVSYTWNFNNFFFSNLPNPTTTYTANGTYTVTLTASTNSFCVSQATAVITITNVTSPCNLNANFNYSQGSNGVVNFNNTTTGTTGSTTYQWSFGDNTSASTLTSPAHTYSANGVYIATLVANNNTTPSCTSTKTLAIFVNSYCNLVAGFTYSQGANGVVNFFNTSTGTASFLTSYAWNFGNGNTSTSQNPSTTYTNNGVYTVTLSVTNFSTSPLCQDTIIQTITVSSNTCVANANFSLMPSGTPQYWFAIPTMTSNISNAVWNWGDGTSSNTLFTSHQYSAAGTYTICLSVTITCGASASYCTSWYIFRSQNGESNQMINVNVVAEGTTGLKEARANQATLNIFPNPATSSFNLQLSGKHNEHLQLSVYNLVGQKVMESDIQPGNGDVNHAVDVTGIPAGMYLVKVRDGNNTYTKQLVIAP